MSDLSTAPYTTPDTPPDTPTSEQKISVPNLQTAPPSPPPSYITQQDPPNVSSNTLPSSNQTTCLPDLYEARSSARALLDTLKEENSPLATAEEILTRCLRITAQLAQDLERTGAASQNNYNGREGLDISKLVECLDALQIYHIDNVGQGLQAGERAAAAAAAELDDIKARLAAQLDKLTISARQHDGYTSRSPGYQSQNHQPPYNSNPHPFAAQPHQMPSTRPFSHNPFYPQGNYKANQESYNTTGNRTTDSHNSRTSHVYNGPSVEAERDFHGVNGTQTNNNYGTPPYGGYAYPGMHQPPWMGGPASPPSAGPAPGQ